MGQSGPWEGKESLHSEVRNVMLIYINMGLVVRKSVFGGSRTIKAQTSLRICAVWSAPLFFTCWISHIKTCYKGNFTILASLCSWASWFGYNLVGNPEDRFCHGEAHIVLLFHSQHGQNTKCADWPEPSLLAYTKFLWRWTLRPDFFYL